MINFLQETLNDIADFGHTPEDIIFIGSRKSGHQCTWDEFQVLADQKYDYADRYGEQRVAIDLEIVFSDGWIMQRSEYPESEGWEIVSPFRKPTEKFPIKTLFSSPTIGCETLAELNKQE